MNTKIFILAVFSIITFGSYALEVENFIFNFLPPDSSSSVVDRTKAVFIIEDGKKLLAEGRTLDALQKFREAYNTDKYSSSATYWIGEAHYKLDNYGYALRYGKLSESLSEAMDGDVFFLLGRAYHRQNQLDSARMNYDLASIQLSTAKKKAYEIDKLIEEVDYAISVQDKTLKYEKTLLDDNVNSGYDDYAALLSADGKTLYFVSRRPDTKGGGINPDDQRYFEDIYFSTWEEEDQKWSIASNEIERLNSEGFDALSYISPDGSEAYLTINTAVLPIKKTTKSSDICVSNLSKENKWSSPKPINNKSINTSFFDGVPTLTADGNTMYFVSDRDGNKSKSDIYVVQKEGKTWGTAKKLPMNVNTAGNETTPFITADGRYLFFSSDGHRGMGGYDIYVTERLGNDEWSTPVNLGPEFNSVNDDIFFKYYDKMNKVYLSTYRIQGNKASMDIYEVEVEGWSIPK